MSFMLRHYLDCWDDDRCPSRDCDLCDGHLRVKKSKSSSLEVRMDDLARQIADLNVLMQDFSRRLKAIENQID